MKKVILLLIILIVVTVVIVLIQVSDNRSGLQEKKAFNAQFEEYIDKELLGTDVMTIINKAIDNNTTNEIPKDDEENFIEDDSKCIKVYLILLTKDEEEKTKEIMYPMETLQRAGLDGFIDRFSLTKFKCNKIEYNSEGRVSKIEVKQIEE